MKVRVRGARWSAIYYSKLHTSRRRKRDAQRIYKPIVYYIRRICMCSREREREKSKSEASCWMCVEIDRNRSKVPSTICSCKCVYCIHCVDETNDSLSSFAFFLSVFLSLSLSLSLTLYDPLCTLHVYYYICTWFTRSAERCTLFLRFKKSLFPVICHFFTPTYNRIYLIGHFDGVNFALYDINLLKWKLFYPLLF